jgi:(5-formylfuran-3-yl)methyl phosphate synthase
MRLLVSVATAADARAAVEGGADIVDAKDPGAGALGAVTLERLREIRDAVAGLRPLTAALGEAGDETSVEQRARAYAEAGATLVKIGLLGTPDASEAGSRLSAAVRGVSMTACGVVAVAYADAQATTAPSPLGVIEVAARAGAHGVLIDTANKTGQRLLELMPLEALTRWVCAGRTAGLQVAVAGKLTAADLAGVAEAGADIAGVRGAVCVGGRDGRVSAELVRELMAASTSHMPRSSLRCRPAWRGLRYRDAGHRGTRTRRTAG